MEMFERMLDCLGPQRWWPAESELEMMVGAVLTQNTNWNNVEKAIRNLKDGGCLSLGALQAMAADELALRIRPAGYYRVKAKRLKNLVTFLADRYRADLTTFLADDTDAIREGLLAVKGVGPETADSILLYAVRRPVFVVDAYTYRILNRHGLAGDQADYGELQGLFMEHLPEDTELYNEFHALIVKTGKEFCRRRPLCGQCPLEHWAQTPMFSE
jgi:endonuclease III related protein